MKWSSVFVAALVVLAVLPLVLTESEAGRNKGPSADPAVAYVDGSRLRVMNADGSNQTQIVRFAGNIAYPNWSPDGKKIVFVETLGDLWTVDVKVRWGKPRGYNLTRLTDTGTGYFTGYPRWSPDGSLIAIEHENDICTVPAVGGSPSILYNAPMSARCPTWSPDGTEIAFIDQYRAGRGPNGKKDRVIVMDVASGYILKTFDADVRPRFSYMEWARTGDTLILEQGFQSSSYNNVFHLMDLSDGTITELMTCPDWGQARPSWSPDDGKIVFAAQNEVMVYDLDSETTTTLATNGWSPDWKR